MSLSQHLTVAVTFIIIIIINTTVCIAQADRAKVNNHPLTSHNGKKNHRIDFEFQHGAQLLTSSSASWVGLDQVESRL